jgi:hypothetical protein
MSNIVELKSRPTQVIESVVERLEEALAEAREGTITAVAIAVVNSDGSTSHSWSEADDFGKLMGAITRLQYRLNVKVDKE